MEMSVLENNRVLTYVKDNYLIIIILLLGSILRIYDLSGESLWLDEVVSIEYAKLSIADQIRSIFEQADNNPPLYYTILHFWIDWFGDSEFSSRLPSAIFGSFSVLFIYMVGCALFDKKVGIISALILAVSEFNIQYSQEARAYSLMALLSLISYYYFLRIMVSRKTIYSVAYVVFSLLLMYSHFYGILIVVAQNIYCFTQFLSHKKAGELNFKRWFYLQLLLGLLFIPGLVLWAINFSHVQTGFWLAKPSIKGFVAYFYHFSSDSFFLFVVFGLFSVLSLVNIKNIKSKGRIREIFDFTEDSTVYPGMSNVDKIYFLLLWVLTPIVLPFIISQISTPILSSRYLIGAAPAFYILVSKGITNTKINKLMLLIIGIIVIVSFMDLRKYYNGIEKHQWRETIEHIELSANEGDYVFVVPSYDKRSASYYLKRPDLKLMELNSESLSKLDKSNYRFWVAVSFLASTQEEYREMLELLRDYELVSEKEYERINLYLYNN